MTHTIDVRDLPRRLNEALQAVQAGDEVIITRENVPCARITSPTSEQPGSRKPNLHPGAIEILEGADDPLPDEFWLGQS